MEGGRFRSSSTGRRGSEAQNVEDKRIKIFFCIENINGHNLKAMDKGVSSDPFLSIFLAGEQRKSTVQKKTLHPKWKDTFFFTCYFKNIQDLKGQTLHIQVIDEDFGLSDYMGSATIDVNTLVFGPRNQRLLLFHEGISAGFLTFDVIASQMDKPTKVEFKDIIFAPKDKEKVIEGDCIIQMVLSSDYLIQNSTRVEKPMSKEGGSHTLRTSDIITITKQPEIFLMRTYFFNVIVKSAVYKYGYKLFKSQTELSKKGGELLSETVVMEPIESPENSPEYTLQVTSVLHGFPDVVQMAKGVNTDGGILEFDWMRPWLRVPDIIKHPFDIVSEIHNKPDDPIPKEEQSADSFNRRREAYSSLFSQRHHKTQS